MSALRAKLPTVALTVALTAASAGGAREARAEAGDVVTVITADRLLGAAVNAVGAQVMSPSWFLDHL